MNDDSTIPLAASEDAILCTFASRDTVSSVLEKLSEEQLEQGARIYEGEEGIKELNTSSQWFADTGKELAWYQRKLGAGMVALFIPVQRAEDHQRIVQLLQSNDVEHITHFGQWTTERMQ